MSAPLKPIALILCAGAAALAAESPLAPWDTALPRHGDPRGETAVEVTFAGPVAGAPLTFGIPLGQAPTAEGVTILDESGHLPASDRAALGNWDTQPARWTLVSCVLDAGENGWTTDEEQDYGRDAMVGPDLRVFRGGCGGRRGGRAANGAAARARVQRG
ncbi:MAG: hypothetical protein JXR94_07865 [Candidatus Hydrogenedentes bacterium]|nr:hypothetical protein [Candidatus Hydrogenedentota bacterium]